MEEDKSTFLFIPSGIATAFMMPIIGKLLQRGVKQQYLVAGGLIVFFIYSLWGYKILTPDTPADAFWWLLILRGFGLSLLFIPITTLALSTLYGQQIGQGGGLHRDDATIGRLIRGSSDYHVYCTGQYDSPHGLN